MSMDEEEVQKQLDNMVKFIFREADEKASEIASKAAEECSIEKQRLVQEEKLKIAKVYETKEKQIEVKKKIMYSNALNQSRLSVLKAREEGIQKLLSESHRRLAELTKNSESYRVLLQKLIVQGLLRLGETDVHVVGRAEDKTLIEAAIQGAAQEYRNKTQKDVRLTLEKTTHLPPGPELAKGPDFCSGGIILSTPDGKIICSNTLDARLSMAFEQQLPRIRTILFGESQTRIHRD